MSEAAREQPGAEELLAAQDPERRLEVLAGVVIEKAAPSGEHSDAQGAITELLRPRFRRGGGGSGGWWILPEPDILFGPADLLRPDLAGWRRERVSTRPTGSPLRERPDWVCEISSPSTARRDMGHKRDVYQRAGVAHYWIVDVEREMLIVLRREAAAYTIVLTAGPDEVVRAEPFEALALPVGLLFGREPEDAGD